MISLISLISDSSFIEYMMTPNTPLSTVYTFLPMLTLPQKGIISHSHYSPFSPDQNTKNMDKTLVDYRRERCQSSDHCSPLCFNICQCETAGYFDVDIRTFGHVCGDKTKPDISDNSRTSSAMLVATKTSLHLYFTNLKR